MPHNLPEKPKKKINDENKFNTLKREKKVGEKDKKERKFAWRNCGEDKRKFAMGKEGKISGNWMRKNCFPF